MQNKAIRDFRKIRADIILPKRVRKAMRGVVFRVAFSRLDCNRFTVVVSTFATGDCRLGGSPSVIMAT